MRTADPHEIQGAKASPIYRWQCCPPLRDGELQILGNRVVIGVEKLLQVPPATLIVPTTPSIAEQPVNSGPDRRQRIYWGASHSCDAVGRPPAPVSGDFRLPSMFAAPAVPQVGSAHLDLNR